MAGARGDGEGKVLLRMGVEGTPQGGESRLEELRLEEPMGIG